MAYANNLQTILWPSVSKAPASARTEAGGNQERQTTDTIRQRWLRRPRPFQSTFPTFA